MIENNSRILVPFDGTELSLRALECAKEEAVKSNSSLILLYILDNSCFCPVGIKDFLSQIQDFDSSLQNYINVLKKKQN
jgi:nucleotide-binding universal stress UspA family protein